MSAQKLITEHLDLWTGAVTKKSSSGRGSNGKVELTGVKKLRALILQLAINGKLVEQNEQSETAESLLSRVVESQAALIASGMVKKKKKLPSVTADDCYTAIPMGWEPVRLGDILDRISNGFGGKQNKTGSGLPVTRIETISDGTINPEKLGYSTEIPNEKQEYFKLQAGDILFSHINSDFHIGKTAIVPSNIEIYHGVNLLLLRPSEFVSNRFIDIVLNALRLDGFFLNIAQHAIGQASVNQTKVNNIAFALPPSEEQHRIVQKVDELMALCDRLEQHTSDQLDAHETLVDTLLGCLLKPAKGSFTQPDNANELADNWARLSEHFDTLFTTEQSIDKLKQTILQLAVMGRLVEQDAEDEPASDLIQRINQERLKLEVEGKVRAVKKTARASVVEPLPGEWAKCTLGMCISLISGQHLKGDEYFDDKRPESVPYLTGPAEFGAQTPEPQRYTFERRAVAEKGDILITCKGSGVGKLNTASEEIAISRQLMAARPILINTRFLYLLLDSLRDAIREKTVGIAIPGISRGDILEANIQLPPLEEQHRIVQKVDELMALCDHLKERLTQASETRCQLAGAVVEGAIM